MKILGKQIRLSMPNGERRKAQFAIVESTFVKASHNEETFASTKGYPTNNQGFNINDRNYEHDSNAQSLVDAYARELNPVLVVVNTKTAEGTPIIDRKGIVVSGNNRTMSIKRAIKNYPEKYKAYLEELKEEWDVFGFKGDIKNLSKFKKPILVRIDYDFKEYTTQELSKYNQSVTKGKRPVDKAIELSNILLENGSCSTAIPSNLEDFERMSDFYNNRNAQKRMIDMLLNCNLLTSQEISTYYDEQNGFTEVGKGFLESTLSASILKKEAILAGDKQGIRSLRRVVITTLPTLMQNKGLEKDALTSYINDAIVYEVEIKSSGLKFEDFINQTSLFQEKVFDKKAIYLNRLLNLGRNKFKKAIEGYNKSLINSGGASLFGNPVTGEEAFEKWIISSISDKHQKIIEQFGGNSTPIWTNDKIQIKNIKINKSATQESTAFSATVYLNGERICTAFNEGQGGSNFYLGIDGKTRKDIDRLEEIAEKQTGRQFEALDWVINDLLIEYMSKESFASILDDVKMCLEAFPKDSKFELLMDEVEQLIN